MVFAGHSVAIMSQGIQILELSRRVREEKNQNAHPTPYNQKYTSILNNFCGIVFT
jgi:hypothetical protein